MKFNTDIKTYFLKPAELCFVHEPSLIRTVLGSCVSITMWCKRTGTAAACHPVLPVCRETGRCRPAQCRQKYKYVECVIPEMIRQFQQSGVDLGELEVKMFGGANMFHHHVQFKKIVHVGSMNISMARQKLNELDLQLKSYEVGGNQGRKIFFDTATGDVWLKKFKTDSAGYEDKTSVQKQLIMQLDDYAG